MPRLRWAALPMLLLLLVILSPVSAAPPPGKGRYIVMLDGDEDPAKAARKHKEKYGAEARRFYRSMFEGYSATVPESRVDELRKDPSVRMVSKNRTFKASAVCDSATPVLPCTPTGVSRIKADSIPGTGDGVQVAVLDSGIDYQHPDLAANVLGGIDCDGADTGNFDDENGHGTHVAGTIAALDDDEGVVGVAPEAELWAVRILNSGGVGDDEGILCGLEFVFNRAPLNGGLIRVANMSIEADFPNADDGNCGLDIGDIIHFAICLVVDYGVTFTVAAGNGTDNIKDVAPAAYDEVITATALADSDGQPCGAGSDISSETDDTFASFSSFATTTADRAHTIGAPGVNILSTVPAGYAFSEGTSMSAPHLAGAAARYIQTHPGTPPATVLDVLRDAGEPEDVNVNDECTDPDVSHTDSGTHPEPVVRVEDWTLPLDASTPGIVRGNQWLLNNGFDAGPDIGFFYGSASDKVVVGDWDGDGVDSPGVVKGNVWYLSNDFDGDNDIPAFGFGSASDRVVVGDWDTDGDDTPAVIKGNVWYLNNGFDPSAEKVFAFGSAGDRIAVGHWNHSGFDLPAVVKSNNTWFLNFGYDPAAEYSFAFGLSSASVFVGDWDGNGIDTPGIRSGRNWFLNSGYDPAAEIWFLYGNSTDRPFVGDWDGVAP